MLKNYTVVLKKCNFLKLSMRDNIIITIEKYGGLGSDFVTEEKINKLINEMTLEEKLGQLTQEFLTGERLETMKELAKKGVLGSCILAYDALAGDSVQEDFLISELNEIQRCAVEESRLGIPVINGRDIIHGSRTIFPIPLAQAATWDYELIKEAASIMSEEASRIGVHWTFAPMLDICTDPRWGRIVECPGEDPLLGRMYAKASVDGIQGDDMSKKGKLAACAKHYIGYGASQGGRDKDPTEWSEYTLRNKALPAFKEAIGAGVATVMSAFNEISGQPATSNKYYLTDVLKKELGFEGFVISDWDAIVRLKCQGVSDDDEHSAVLAVNAGVDMDMVDGLYKNNLKNAIDKGLVSMETIDEAVRRVLKIKFKLGLFENPYIDEDNAEDADLRKEYLDKAKKLSLHSMVLLKNNGVLPLAKGEKVIVGGPFVEDRVNIMGSWFAGGDEKEVVTLAEGVTLVNGENNTFVKGIKSEEKYAIMDNADTVIIALGEERYITGEGKTMADIELEESQVAQIKNAKLLGKKVIAVVFAGRPLALTHIVEYCDAILWAWHGGTMCGLASAEILFGDFNPCGKLPVTFPRSTGQIPIHYNHNPNEYVTSGYYSHESYVATNSKSTPLYAFGEGLSYTDFEYNNFEYSLSDNAFKVSFDIENKGEVDGFEIAQCYVRDMVASIARPVKELKAFKKIFIKSGDRKKISFSLSKEDLSFYDARGNFVFEPGKFKIEIGKACNNICFEVVEQINF